MKNRMFKAALVAAFALTGCDAMTGATVAPMTAENVDGPVLAVDYALVPASQPRYGLAATTATSTTTTASAVIPIKQVTASSTRNSYFSVAYLTDGNLHSAWSPAATDAAPSLTLDLGATSRLSGIGLKLSEADVTVDVAVASNGTWKTVATGLAPETATLSDLSFAACQGDRVKLTFKGPDVAKLLVCEVEVRGTKVAGPTPSTAPSASPTAAPSAVPSAQPTSSAMPTASPSAMPTTMPTKEPCGEPCAPPVVEVEDEDCVVVGGGWTKKVKFKKKRHVTFACAIDRKGGGTVVVHDLVKKVKRVGRCETVKRHGNVVMITGTLDDGEKFACTVVDGDRHNQPDTWSFTCADGDSWTGRFGGGAGHGGGVKVEADRAPVVVPVVMPDLLDLDQRCERDDEDDEDARGWHRGKGKGHDKGRGKGHDKHHDRDD